MLLNEYGFPLLESDDYASPAALASFAGLADAAFQRQEAEIDLLEVPEVMIDKLSSNQLVASTSNELSFDTLVYRSRAGAFPFSGVLMSGGVWRPGIYHAGLYVQVTTSGTVTGIPMDLTLYDKRGFKLLNTYAEAERVDEGGSVRGAVDLCIDRIFEIRSTDSTSVVASIGVVGGGTITASAGASRLWIYRMRGF